MRALLANQAFAYFSSGNANDMCPNIAYPTENYQYFGKIDQ